MTGGEAAIDEHFLHFLRQRQKPQEVGHRRAALAKALGDALLRKTRRLHQAPDAGGFFHGVEVVALKVFDQRRFEALLLVPIADDGGYLLKSRQPCGAKTALAGDDLVALARFAHDDGLQNAHGADGLGQFAQRRFLKALAGLAAVGVDVRQFQGAHLVAGCFAVFRRLAQKRAQAAAQAALHLCRHTIFPHFCRSALWPARGRQPRRCNGHRSGGWACHSWALRSNARCGG